MTIANSPVEALEQKRVAQAKELGYSLFAISPEGDVPGFVYSIGMAQHELPEFITFFPGDHSQAAVNILSQLLPKLIDGLTLFNRTELLSALVSKPLTVHDPLVHYSWQLLTGDDFRHALDAYLTRAARYRGELGMPKGVLVLEHPECPSFQHIRAMRMFAVS